MIRKIERALRIVTLLVIIIAAVGVGLSNFTNYFENVQDAKARSAVAECLEFLSPHAVVSDGNIYCYLTIQGSEMVAPIESLRYKSDAK